MTQNKKYGSVFEVEAGNLVVAQAVRVRASVADSLLISLMCLTF
jgi:hypothetical protein